MYRLQKNRERQRESKREINAIMLVVFCYINVYAWGEIMFSKLSYTKQALL